MIRSIKLALWIICGVCLGLPGMASADPLEGYFVCRNGSLGNSNEPSGSDSNSGRSMNQAWASANKVNSTSIPQGADVYFCEGDVQHDQPLLANWSGTANNRAIIGCYYNDAGTPRRCNAPRVHKRPELNGTFEASCRANYTCDIERGNALPNNRFRGLLHISADYVTIQDFRVADSSGSGIGSASDSDYVSVLNSEVAYTAFQSFRASPRSNNTLLRGNEFHHSVMCDKDQFRPAYSTCATSGAGGGGGHPPAVGLCTRTEDCNGLAEDNDIYSSYGEGLSCIRGSNCIVRGNRIRDVRATCILLDGFEDAVVEENICWAPTDGDFGYTTTRAIAVISVEDLGSPNERSAVSGRRDSVNNVVRNNIGARLLRCIDWAMFRRSRELGYKLEGKIYGNTCLDPSGDLAIRDPHSEDIVLPSTEYANNIFYAPRSRRSCADAGRRSQYSANYWSENPPNECRSGDQLIGKPALRRDVDQWAYTVAQGPRFADAMLAPGGETNAGVPLQGNVINADNYDMFSELSYPYRPTRSLWERKNAYDAVGNRRDPQRPEIGALERSSNGAPPKPPVLF